MGSPATCQVIVFFMEPKTSSVLPARDSLFFCRLELVWCRWLSKRSFYVHETLPFLKTVVLRRRDATFVGCRESHSQPQPDRMPAQACYQARGVTRPGVPGPRCYQPCLEISKEKRWIFLNFVKKVVFHVHGMTFSEIWGRLPHAKSLFFLWRPT